jgi:hypothetical protein
MRRQVVAPPDQSCGQQREGRVAGQIGAIVKGGGQGNQIVHRSIIAAECHLASSELLMHVLTSFFFAVRFIQSQLGKAFWPGLTE